MERPELLVRNIESRGLLSEIRGLLIIDYKPTYNDDARWRHTNCIFSNVITCLQYCCFKVPLKKSELIGTLGTVSVSVIGSFISYTKTNVISN